MKIIYNSIIPFQGYAFINICGILFGRKEYKNKINEKVINHESIHSEQMKELGYIFFYIFYLLEWIIKIPFSWFYKQPSGKYITKVAYHSISFEQEAFYNENDYDYLNERKRYNWIKRIFTMYNYKLKK